MPVVPRPPAFSPGMSSTTQLEQLAESVRFLQDPPMAKIIAASPQSIPNGSATTITLGTATYDPYSMWDSGDPTAVYAMYPGWYQISGGVSFASNATGYRFCNWLVNGSSFADSAVTMPAASGLVTRLVAKTTFVYLNVGSFVEISVLQNSGGALNTATALADASSINIRWISN